uniref:Uncharacterized protein n=1 Tax=Candidatus Kentrum sp. DK TaxID=2126562 RepID=A0A450TQ77_9GAMM|nr:MAG: hypothetical protein BECKDK2373B_GA0170837_12701 [Candidatus Kentron sp. DK]
MPFTLIWVSVSVFIDFSNDIDWIYSPNSVVIGQFPE